MERSSECNNVYSANFWLVIIVSLSLFCNCDMFAEWQRATGVFFLELAHNFRRFRAGGESHKLKLYVGHDGTMIRLASLLGLGKVAPLRWPALGSEIIIEVSGSSRHSDKADRKFDIRCTCPGLAAKQW